jgi:hypothetical protein
LEKNYGKKKPLIKQRLWKWIVFMDLAFQSVFFLKLFGYLVSLSLIISFLSTTKVP